MVPLPCNVVVIVPRLPGWPKLLLVSWNASARAVWADASRNRANAASERRVFFRGGIVMLLCFSLRVLGASPHAPAATRARRCRFGASSGRWLPQVCGRRFRVVAGVYEAPCARG